MCCCVNTVPLHDRQYILSFFLNPVYLRPIHLLIIIYFTIYMNDFSNLNVCALLCFELGFSMLGSCSVIPRNFQNSFLWFISTLDNHFIIIQLNILKLRVDLFSQKQRLKSLLSSGCQFKLRGKLMHLQRHEISYFPPSYFLQRNSVFDTRFLT